MNEKIIRAYGLDPTRCGDWDAARHIMKEYGFLDLDEDLEFDNAKDLDTPLADRLKNMLVDIWNNVVNTSGDTAPDEGAELGQDGNVYTYSYLSDDPNDAFMTFCITVSEDGEIVVNSYDLLIDTTELFTKLKQYHKLPYRTVEFDGSRAIFNGEELKNFLTAYCECDLDKADFYIDMYAPEY